MKLTIGRMATLYGLHRSTLHEAVAKGRITAGLDGKGQKVIDLSEMIRVYGEPPGQTRHAPTVPIHSLPTSVSGDLAVLIAAAVAEAVAAAVNPLKEEIEKLRETLLRIEHKPDSPPQTQATVTPTSVPIVEPDDPWSDIFNSLKERQ